MSKNRRRASGTRTLGTFGGVFTPDELLTIRYSSNTPVAAHYTATIGDETMSTAFQTQLSDLVVLSGGFDGGADAGAVPRRRGRG